MDRHVANINLAPRASTQWHAAVDLARRTYATTYGADIDPDPDCVLVLGDEPEHEHAAGAGEGRTASVAACAGMTFGADRPFFCEHYLDAPLPVAIEQRLGTPVDRHHCVEVGPLASRRQRAGLELVRLTPIVAWCQGMRYIACTVTPHVTEMFGQLGIRFVPLGVARLDHVPPPDRARWGRYYEYGPFTGVIPLDSIAPLFSECTGRYAFRGFEAALLAEGLGRREVAGAHA